MTDKPRERPQCVGRRADGRPCGNAPLRGTDRCWHHSFKVPGRPSKLTPELAAQISYAVLEGNYLETAAQTVGVNKTTLYRWLRRADEAEAKALEHVDPDVDGEDLYNHADPADWPYLDFRHALKSAEAWAEAELVRKAGRAGPGWQAFMTILERRHPARWRRRDSHDHQISGEVSRTVELVVPSDEERALVLERLREAGALVAPDTENTNDQEDPDDE